MPSVILGNSSGGQDILSGTLWSGRTPKPVGGVQLRLSRSASGNAYVALSGNVTVNSGGVLGNSGTYLSGLMDGMVLYPGDPYFVPAMAFREFSGNPQLFVASDPAGSGVSRMYWEVY